MPCPSQVFLRSNDLVFYMLCGSTIQRLRYKSELLTFLSLFLVFNVKKVRYDMVEITYIIFKIVFIGEIQVLI